MADNKLGDAYVELALKDEKFQKRLAQSRVKLDQSLTQMRQKANVRLELADKAFRDGLAKDRQRFAQSLSQMQSRAAASMRISSARFQQNVERSRARFNQALNDMRQRATIRLELKDQAFRQRLAQNAMLFRQRMSFRGQMGHGDILRGAGSALAGFAGGASIMSGVRQLASGMKDLAVQSVRTNMALAQQVMVLEKLTGSAIVARMMMREMLTFAAETPFEMPDLAQAATSLLATHKIASGQVLPTIRKLADAAAGSADGFASMPHIVRAISQMLNKGKVTAEEMLQLAEAGIPAWDALASAMGKSTAEVQKMSQQGKLGTNAVLKLIDELGRRYSGLSQTMSKGLSGLLSTARDELNLMLADIGKPLFDTLTEGAKRFVAALQSEAMRNFAATMRSVVEGVSSLARVLMDSRMAQAGVAFGAIFTGLMGLTTAIAGIVGLFVAFPPAAIGAAAAIGLVVAAVPQMAALSMAAIAVYKAIQAIAQSKHGKAIAANIRESWALLKEIASNLARAIRPAVVAIGAAFKGWVQSFGDRWGARISALTKGLRELLDVVSLMTFDFEETAEIVKESFGIAIQNITEQFQFLFTKGLPGLVKTFVTFSLEAFGAMAQEVAGMIGGALLGRAPNIKQSITNLARNLADAAARASADMPRFEESADLTARTAARDERILTLGQRREAARARRMFEDRVAPVLGPVLQRARQIDPMGMLKGGISGAVRNIVPRGRALIGGALDMMSDRGLRRQVREEMDKEQREEAEKKKKEFIRRIFEGRDFIGQAIGKLLTPPKGGRRGLGFSLGDLMRGMGAAAAGAGQAFAGAGPNAAQALAGVIGGGEARAPARPEFVEISNLNKRIQTAMQDKKKDQRENKKVDLLGKIAGGVKDVVGAVGDAADVIKKLPVGFAE